MLSEEELQIYERLYGSHFAAEEEVEELENEEDDEAATKLLKEGEDGEL